MIRQRKTQFWSVWLLLVGGALVEILLGVVGFPGQVLAQITPDETLGEERSQITRDVEVRGGRADRIDGGARRGANLFHSFQEFNVNDGQRVYFANPSGVENILGRVTGNDISDIMGTLGVDGGANLFLINPNGIIFGPNVRLDVSGSFFATTADRFTFTDGSVFSATNPQAPSLLSVSVPIGVQFGANPAGGISSQGTLAVRPDHSLALLGGTINLTSSRLIAPGGHIELGGVSGVGTVGLTTQRTLFSLSFPEHLELADISLLNGSLLGIAAENGGSATITARNLDISGGSRILAGIYPGRGFVGSQAGDVTLRATEGISVSQLSGIYNIVNPGSTGSAGDIRIRTGSLSVTDGSQLISSTYGLGDAGDIHIDADDRISFIGLGNLDIASDDNSGGVFSRVERGATGHGGDISVTTGSLFLGNVSVLTASTLGDGDAGNVQVQARDRILLTGSSLIASQIGAVPAGNGGDIRITTGSLSAQDGSQISTANFGQGNSGSIRIEARNRIAIDGFIVDSNGTFIPSGLFSNAENLEGVGDTGDIDVITRVLAITGGAKITASVSGQGNSGDIWIRAQDRINIDGNSAESYRGPFFPGGIFSDVGTGAIGNGGNIRITTGLLSVTGGATVGTGTNGRGDGGNIWIRARDRINVDGGRNANGTTSQSAIASGLGAAAIGDGGNIRIITRLLSVTDGAQVSTQTSGRGDGGNIRITAYDRVSLNREGVIFAGLREGGVGGGGDIQVSTSTLSILNGARVLADADGRGSAGNIRIDARGHISINGFETRSDGVTVPSSVSTNLLPGRVGNGGNIQISASSLSILNGANIGAGTFGQGDSGNIHIEIDDSMRVDGGSRVSPSGLFSSAEVGAIGDGGDIQISTGSLSVLNGGQIRASTSGRGDAGNIRIDASDYVSFDGVAENGTPGGTVSTVREGAVGNAGDIDINTELLSISNNAVLSTRSLGQGRAGDIDVSASAIQLNQGRIESVNTAQRGGNITLRNLDILSLRNGSTLSATAGINQAGGSGGNITIDAEDGFIVADPNENNDITANAFTGSGGRVDITAAGIFGLAPRTREELEALLDASDPSALDPANLPSSDITAISQTSPSLSGAVTLTTPDTDPSRGLTELPTDVVDATNQINQTCPSGARTTRERSSSFVITGRGGLPPSPEDALNGSGLQTGWATLDNTESSAQSSAVTAPQTISEASSQQEQLVEAQGWVRGENGEVIFLSPAQTAPQPSTSTPVHCQ